MIFDHNFLFCITLLLQRNIQYSLVPKTTRGKSNKNGNPEPPVITSSSSGNGLMHSDSLRLTDDDRVSAFVIYASLLSRSRRLKEANKILAEAKVR